MIKNQIGKSFGQIINSVYPFLAEKIKKVMKGGKTLIIIGIIVGFFGGIFHLQGQSIVGPESSFMYSNPDWITYGIQMIIVGIVVFIIGTIVLKKSNL